MLKNIPEHINEYYDLYSSTPKGIRIRRMLEKVDARCQWWMSGAEVERLKRELFVQIMEDDLIEQEEQERVEL